MSGPRPTDGATVRAVFLDRDGVLVGSDVVDGVPVPAAEPTVLPGVADACRDLRAAGWKLVMVTNQPDIARGKITRAEVDAVNDRLRADLGLDDVRICPHDDVDACPCRKPQPGMLTDAAARHAIDLAASVMVGDRWRDVDAGRAAGTRTVLVDREYLEGRPADADVVVTSLAEAVTWILGTSGGGAR